MNIISSVGFPIFCTIVLFWQNKNIVDTHKEEGISDKNENVVTTVIVKGTKDVLNSIEKSNVKAIVDLSGLKEGVHEVAVIVTGDDARATYSPKITKIKIRIIKANG